MSDLAIRDRRSTPWVLALVAVLAVQAVVLYDPNPGGPGLFAGADKIVHAGLFALPVVVAARAVGRRWWWVAVALAGHAPVSEMLQGLLLPLRSADPWDAVADLVGVGLGVLLARTVVRASAAR